MTTSDDTGGSARVRTLPCPSCDTEFVVGAERCKACGLLLTGPLAVRLWQIDQDLASLTKTRSGALAELRAASRPGASSAAMTQPHEGLGPIRLPDAVTEPVGVSAAAGSGPPAGVPTPVVDRPVSGGSAQHLLLGFGVLLLFMASVVFVAVAWDVLGVYGRMLALAVAIAACGGLATYCSNRRLAASAEAFAVLAVGMSVVGLVAAYALDLFGVGTLSVRHYLALAAALLAVVAAALHRGARPVMTYPLVALAGAWAAAVAVLADETVLGWAGGLLAGWLVVASPLVRWARRLVDPADALIGSAGSVWGVHGASGGRAWAPLWPPALLSGAAGFALATLLIASARADAVELITAGGLVAVSLAVVGQALGAHRPFTDLPPRLVVPSITVWLLLGVELAALVRNVGVGAVVLLASVAIVLLVLLLSIRSQRTQAWSPHLGTAAVGAGVTSATLVVLDGEAGASAFVLALLAAGAAALAVAEPPWRPRAEAVGTASALAALGFALVALEASPAAATFTYSFAGTVLAVLAAGRRPARNEEEQVLGLGAVVALSVSIVIALVDVTHVGAELAEAASAPATVLAIAFGIAAAVAVGYSFVEGRGWIAIAAVPLTVATVWTPMFDVHVTTLEWYTFSAALVCGVAGFIVHLRVADAGSWVTVGPAVGFALLPSALVATASDSALRLVYVIVVGAALMLLGYAQRSQALFALSGAALALVSVQELFLLVLGLPPTLTFLVAGALLVGAGVRYERNVRDLRAVGVWFDSMT